MFDKKSLISQKYKKNSPAKYALLLYLGCSIRSVSIMFDFLEYNNCRELWLGIVGKSL